MSAAAATAGEARPGTVLVIAASTAGTLFEWYDFYLYGTLAPQLAKHFFPAADQTAALLAVLASFGAGLIVRPLGGIAFGVMGDTIGRKRTFLVTIVLMGVSTFGIGLIPTYAQIGVWSTVILVALRMLQGMALGGEFSGAAVYVAEHAPAHRRGLHTGWLQTAGMIGFLLTMAVVAACEALLGAARFEAWGWRVPFLVSAVLIAISIGMRLKLDESPVFRAMLEQRRTSRRPFVEALTSPGNLRRIVAGVVGITAGMSVIFYTAEFSVLYFLQGPAGVDGTTAKLLLGAATLIGIPMVVVVGWLSDRTGRKPLLVASYVLALALVVPMYRYMAESANPALAAAVRSSPVRVTGADCRFDAFSAHQQTPCGQTLAFLNSRGIGYERRSDPAGPDVRLEVGSQRVEGFDPAGFDAALAASGYPRKADPARIDRSGVILATTVLILLAVLAYAHAAALLVELFPARIRYTSMALSHNIGSACFGGLQPLVATWIAAMTGDVFGGLVYTLAVVALALLVSVTLLREP